MVNLISRTFFEVLRNIQCHVPGREELDSVQRDITTNSKSLNQLSQYKCVVEIKHYSVTYFEAL